MMRMKADESEQTSIEETEAIKGFRRPGCRKKEVKTVLEDGTVIRRLTEQGGGARLSARFC
jgi:hypothetical protein